MTVDKKGRLKRWMAIALSAFMIAGAVPASVFAADPDFSVDEAFAEETSSGEASGGNETSGDKEQEDNVAEEDDQSGDMVYSDALNSELTGEHDGTSESGQGEEPAEGLQDSFARDEQPAEDRKDSFETGGGLSEDDENIPVQDKNIPGEKINDALSREDGNDTDDSGENNAVYYTVTLDANGGYFANEWDDILNESVERTDIINREIPSGETVNNIVPIMEQENADVTFLGWSLERGGEDVWAEYAPAEDCMLYAVWRVETAEDTPAGEEAVPGEDVSSGDTEWQEETTEDTAAGEETVPVENASSGDTEWQEETTEDTAAGEETVPVENASSGDTEWQEENAEDTTVGEAYVPEIDAAQDGDTAPETDAAQNEDTAPEMDAAAQEDDTVPDSGAAQDTVDYDPLMDAVEDAAFQEDYETAKEAETAQASGDTDAAEGAEAGTTPEKTNKVETGTSDQQNTTEEQETAHTLTDSADAEEETVREDAAKSVVKSGTYGSNLTWTLDDEGTLTISGTGEMRNYTNKTCIFWNYSVKKVIIENGVTSLGNYVFCNCKSLTSVSISNSVTSIGSDAFDGCIGLTNVTIPDSVTSIGSWAFCDCESLTSVTIPNSVTSIGGRAFNSCSSLTSVTIPDSVTSIEDGTFGSCKSLTSVTIPDSVTSIGDYAFKGCSSLKSMTIPNSVTSIGISAFYGCSSLKSMTIPNSVTSIEFGTFENCKSLTSVTIPDSVTSIGNYAFYECTSLKKVTIPKNVTSIGEKAFYNCSSLSNVTIPASVTNIGRYAFEGTKNASLHIAEGVDRVSANCFFSGVDNIHIPKSVKYVGSYDDWIGWGWTIKIKDIYYAGTINEWKSIRCFIDHSYHDVKKEDFYTRLGSNVNVHIGELYNNSITAKNITVKASNQVQIIPVNASATPTYYNMKYSSNNPNIAVSSGTITIKKNYVGSATITMTASAQYYKTAKKKITVTVKKAKPTITASNKTRTASVKKQTFKIGAKTTGGKLSYKSNTKGISVNSSGTVTVGAKFVGKGTITITSAPGNAFYKAVKKITVTVKKQAPTITAKNIKKYVAKSAKTYDLGAKSSINGKLQYKSNNKNITVNSAGKITVKKNYGGKATITISMPATAIRKAASKKITVSVVKRNNPITASSITTYYASGKKILDIGAYAKGKTKLTYSSDNSYIKVSQKGVVTVSAGYVGKATITIKTSGNTYYKASSKKITVTVKDSVPGTGSGSAGSSGGSSLARECQQCNGTGICPICNGTGGHYYGNPLKWSACLSCGGKTTCHYCGGDGIKDN